MLSMTPSCGSSTLAGRKRAGLDEGGGKSRGYLLHPLGGNQGRHTGFHAAWTRAPARRPTPTIPPLCDCDARRLLGRSGNALFDCDPQSCDNSCGAGDFGALSPSSTDHVVERDSFC